MSVTGQQGQANKSTLWAAVFVEELVRAGVKTACVAPGSRSTPLTFALAAHQEMETLIHLDERACGFFALGHAKATGLPVVLVCTSGSAAANFHPAVLEASHGEVPLLVLTADRPPHLRGNGAAQSTDQIHLFGNAVRWFFEVGEPVMADPDLRNLRTLAGRAFGLANGPRPGPVHLNFPFRKPLEPTPLPGDIPENLTDRHALAMEGLYRQPFAQLAPSGGAPHPDSLNQVARWVTETQRGLIVCGPALPGNGKVEWGAELAELALATGFPVLTEPPSGVHSGPHVTPHFLGTGELFLGSPTFRNKLSPQLVIRFGSMPTSKQFEVLLEATPGARLVVVNPGGTWNEPTAHPALIMTADPGAFCQALTRQLPGPPPGSDQWLDAFKEAEKITRETINTYLETQEGWFEGRVHAELAALMPPASLQFTASSMPIRDLEIFTPVSQKPVRHLVNRGLNGIDGTISSALGAAGAVGACGTPALLVIGDVAFQHDATGLFAAMRHNISLTIVLINNGGGGIFAFLPIAGFGQTYEEFFGTPHNIDFQPLCKAYNVPLERPANWVAFRQAVKDALQTPGTQVIEVITERASNKALHQQLRDTTGARLAEFFPPDRRIS